MKSQPVRIARGTTVHITQMKRWMHSHHFIESDAHAERRTRLVAAITGCTMVAEIVVGWMSGSMALLADGWHMGTHMFALGIAAYAYRFARLNRNNPAFTFGTGKVASLAGFTSAVVLGMVAVGMVTESASRLINPQEIRFGQAMAVAVIGFIVNIGSALLLQDGGRHEHHGHDHHHDHNRRAAFIHVVADALTSLLAMVALVAVRFWNLRWMDPGVAVLGAVLITVWAVGLLRDSGRILLDAGVSAEKADQIRKAIESDADNRVADLHVWHIDNAVLSVALTVVTHYPKPPDHYRTLLRAIPEVQHSTIEVVEHRGDPCMPVDSGS